MNSVVKQRIADIQRGNVPAGYRKTKCGIIPDTWSCCQPKEIFSGKSIKNNDSELPVLSVTQENGVMLRSEMDKDISYKEDSVSSYKRVDIGDFVISLRSFEGGIEYSQCQGVVSPAYTIFSHSEDVDGSFYKYYFKTDFFINKLNTAVYGIRDGKQIGFQDFSNLFIHCPPLGEQRRIAKILGCCDRMIALKKELIEEKKKQKKALMQKLLNPDSGFRLPGFSGEWRKVYVSDVSELLTGYPFASENFSLTGTKLLRCSNVKRGVLDWDPSITVYWNYCENLDEFQLQAGDIVIAMDGALVGYSFSKITPDDLPMLLVQRVARLRSTGICQDYLAHCIINPAFGEHIERVKTDTAIPHMSPKDILGYAFYMPTCAKEQQAIADILSAADKEIDLLEQELAQQEQKKKSLMQLLLTGIVRM